MPYMYEYIYVNMYMYMAFELWYVYMYVIRARHYSELSLFCCVVCCVTLHFMNKIIL